MNKDTKASARMRYFDKTVFIPSVIENICSKNEQYMKQFLEKIGFSIGKDFVRQYPIGDKFVLDFAFVNEKICIEIDGEDHKRKRFIF